jgi:hydrogenase maturation protein HypF
MGRLFDAVAALAGIRPVVSHEGQAAMRLEALARDTGQDGCYPFELIARENLVIDTRPLIRKVLDDRRRGCTSGVIARRFHSTLVEMIAQVCSRMAGESGLSSVVLSGGVFMNALLTSELSMRLRRDGFRV